MRLTQRTAIVIAVVCATLAAILIYFYLQSLRPQQAKPQAPTQVDVVVPLADIAPSSIITADMVVVRKVSADQAPKAALRSVDQVVNYVALSTLRAQQPITQSQVAPRGLALGLPGIVPPGMRAMTVALDPVSGVAGLLKPGDRVDVVATFEVGDVLIARTVIQDVELLALGQQTMSTQEEAAAEPEAAANAAGEKPATQNAAPAKKTTGGRAEPTVQPNATLAVTPQDAQRLMLADQRGKLRLALRPVGEHDIVPVPPTDVASVAGPEYVRLQVKAREASAAQVQPPAQPAGQPAVQPSGPAVAAPAAQPRVAAPAPAKPTRTVEVIRGGEKEQVVP